MCKDYTRMALPSKNYRELLGTAICVFNSNNAFIIETYLRVGTNADLDWYKLIDKTSGQMLDSVKEIIKKASGEKIVDLFDLLCKKRNRISHGFQITDTDGEQRLATKDKENRQFVITENFLIDFIQENQKLSDLLYELRGY
ncbi:selenium binding protein [Parabacteroides goldsteinii]